MDMVNMATKCFIWSLIGLSCHLSLHYGYSYLRWQKLVRINELIDPNKYMMSVCEETKGQNYELLTT
jgi:hypothetical protein